MSIEVDGRKVAYAVAEPYVQGEHMIVACVENDEGHRPILDYGSGTKERMEALAEELNTKAGYTETEVFKIVASTMFKKRRR